MKKVISFILMFSLVMSLCACSGQKEVIKTPIQGNQNETPNIETEVEKPIETPVETPEIKEPKDISLKNEDEVEKLDGSYNVKLLTALLKNEDILKNNLCVSPFSLKQALLMLAQGAEEDSETYKELLGFLDLSGDIDTLNGIERNNNALLCSSESAKFSISNLVLLDDGLIKSNRIQSNFITPLENSYFAKVVDKDLENEEIVTLVNDFVNKATNGTIPTMISTPFNPDTLTVLLNAIYFLGDWEQPFKGYNTYPEDFNGVEEVVQVDMMNDERTVQYKENELYKSIILPYKYDESVVNTPQYEMVLYVAKDKNMIDVFNNLSVEEKENLLTVNKSEYEYENTMIKLPKFEINNTLGLMEVLKEMGLSKTVSLGNMDFTNIKDYEKDPIGFKVSNVIQKTYIKVDEEGTEASAVTMIEMTNDSIVLEEERPKEFFADEPFIYMIRDSYTNTVLFMGMILNLT